jgi:hypothetical protein
VLYSVSRQNRMDVGEFLRHCVLENFRNLSVSQKSILRGVDLQRF